MADNTSNGNSNSNEQRRRRPRRRNNAETSMGTRNNQTTLATESSSSSSSVLRATAPAFVLTPSQTIRSTSTTPTTGGASAAGEIHQANNNALAENSKLNKNKGNEEENNTSSTTGKKSRNRRGGNNRQRGPKTSPHEHCQQNPGLQKPNSDGPSMMDDESTREVSPQVATSGNQPRGSWMKGGAGGERNKPSPSESTSPIRSAVGNNKPRTNNQKKKTNKPKKRYPWRRFIPKGTVDPITLESLQSLEYPPFALCADDPYIPVPVWPIEEEENDDEAKRKNNDKPSVEELNRRRLAEQWGSALLPKNAENESTNDDTNSTKKPVVPLRERPLNLYDGRALAYYLVSQLQFIDPLNRRDLTRPELIILDRYLTRHGFTDVHVTEAYDAKGITLSTAGSAATTAQGRADILQQMAQQLLNSLFTGHSVSAVRRGGDGNDDATTTRQIRSNAESFSLQEQYAAMQRQEQARFRQAQQAPNAAAPRGFGEAAYYGSAEDGGIMIIDDDENPGMRGGEFPALNGAAGDADTPRLNLYSSSRITDRYGEGSRPTGAMAFPPLAPPSQAGSGNTATVDQTTHASNKKQPPKASKTLSIITGIVKKTSEEEKQRQWEAREAARRKAMLSNLAFGVNPSMVDRQQGLLTPPQATDGPVISEEQLQRNRAFAEALGVKPKTQRHYSSGWSRPVDGALSLDEYGNELDAALYSEVLIAVARQRMPLLLKLEKKWKAFLVDDKAASLPLNPMDKPSRTFVHHYSDFWNLKTESFDPEPKRYVHCVKLLETRMPNPLLSDVAANWRGPLPDVSRIHLSDHESQQTAGQPSRSRELPPPPDRVPLPLKPRSMSPGAERRYLPPVTEKGGAGLVEANAPNAARSTALLGRDRPKLELAPRTVPLELPPYDPHQRQQEMDASAAMAAYDAAEDLRRREARMAERRQRERDAEEKKRQALEKAFASDDEEEERDNRGRGRGSSVDDSDSEWGDEPQPVYAGSDEED
jgi:hypothetical protein